VENKRTDISQIQKYLNGELDAKAMHRLEREAQDDPFLMDALEGYTQSGNQQAGLADLSARLNNRVDNKVKRLIPWTAISIAAGVVGFMIVVGLFYKNGNVGKPPQTAQLQQVKPNADSVKTLSEVPVINQKQALAILKPASTPVVHAPERVLFAKRTQSKYKQDSAGLASSFKGADQNTVGYSNAAPRKDSVPLDEMVMGYIAREKDSTSFPETVAVSKLASSRSLNVKARGVTITERPGIRQENNAYVLGELATKVPAAKPLTGVVVSRADGLPLPGVSVKVVGKTTATQTDVNGKFALPGVDNKETLAFSYIGFNTKELNTKAKDSLKVELDVNASSLNEVVVVSPNKYKAGEASAKAHPRDGWSSYQNYLKQNALLPAGSKTGTVKLKFTVNANGNIENIVVIKSLSPVANEQAIAIVRNGPQWIGNTNSKPEVVTLQVKFEHGK
jgi:TonB family protein